ncbi:glycosyltransferase family 4 protein [Paucihalobacter ruber]|uniref:Glycosyltransferase family 4 protein n=1 Tax=Paucihalobacter ruber TaxID=2567861 RepID=A0A506PMK9_9FLAO|nr:glycosyltransferase [Paucihalobacter ruber]TPV34961.1 glycosyltransferase family 4 protein [Paucihalobacter ruber]
MNKVKIAHIVHSVGGVDVSLRLILESIDPCNFESIVIHGTGDAKSAFIDKNGKSISEFKLPLQRNISIIRDCKCLIHTIKILKRHRPDIIHGHSAKGGIIAKLVGYNLKIPVLHTPQAYSYLSASNKLKKSVYLLIEKMISFRGNKILASSNSEKNRALFEVGYPENRVLLFNNSIRPIVKIQSLSINKTWPDEYICSVGRPSYQKNIELMLDVLVNLKNKKNNIHLVLMGVGFHSPNLRIVKNKIRRLNLESNITLLEWTSREDIFNIIKNSQLYLSTARYEGLPYSIIESLALAKPIVATNVDGNRDLVIDNYNGRLIRNENVSALSKSVMEIINSEDLKQKYSLNSLKLFNENFNILNNINQLENIYKKTARYL